MTTTSPDTWLPRDLPVLAALVTRWDQQGRADSWELVEPTGLEHRLIDRAGQALRDAGLIDAMFIDSEGFTVTRISGEARRAVGSWPTAETFADRLLAAIEQGLANATTDDERSRWQKLWDGAKGAGRDVMVNASGSALGGGALAGLG